MCLSPHTIQGTSQTLFICILSKNFRNCSHLHGQDSPPYKTFSLYYWPSPAVTCICIKERPQFCLEQANYIKTWYKYWAPSLKKLLNTLYFYFLNSLELKYEKYEHLQLSTKLYKIEVMKLYKIEVTAVYLHFICCTGWVGRVQTKAELPWCRSGLSFPVHH